ncbi:NADP-dependent aldehyde dehydrogenase [Flaviramulus basaltis]|uniref:NADP-dependent aldehyde dehydrogenase n=1 Tax=Flaviramulus basaltis TaxID=369401 RepID=A0A1K2IHZ5_9FLAO|nr:aldehyde dehydrogenase (NADP(+)) [Flaviramulus basaltis]SFZ92023.1 NADP-dependent aldehyde dehydrogenase [Flaviramulus basaltis]
MYDNMNLTGQNFIAGKSSGQGTETFVAINPSSGTELQTYFHEATSEEINEAVTKANEAFLVYGKKSGKEKADFLDAIAEEILNLGDSLIERCCAETGLPEGRITGERGRTMNQLKLFASVLREGSWVDARIDTAIPDRQPLPKPDIRSMQKPLGVVGVFGASNFPLAFSVAGGDTASALASGCSIIVKAHPSHPGTCELIAIAIQKAVEKTNMPNGTFSMLQGKSVAVGMAIVNHPLVKAIGFTGSNKGGVAIFNAANKRDEPIPVYAEMGSTNPVFILPNALKERGDEIAQGLTSSVTLGVGQFCTNPGIVFLNNDASVSGFQKKLSENFQQVDANTMLNSGIKSSFDSDVKNLSNEIELLAQGKENNEGFKGSAHVFKTSAKNFLIEDYLEEEVFGPSTITITADSKEELLASAQKLKGHLTATLFATEQDLKNHTDLIEILEQKVGRLIINNFPTGVEVCHSMVHGGPFPATTNSRSTSVGTGAITRFTRPVCYQNFPQDLLSDELKDKNSLNIFRMINGEIKK